MIKVYGNPNQVINTWVGNGSRKKLVVLFQFDENGEHEIDETTISKETLNKIKNNFRIEEIKSTKKKIKKD